MSALRMVGLVVCIGAAVAAASAISGCRAPVVDTHGQSTVPPQGENCAPTEEIPRVIRDLLAGQFAPFDDPQFYEVAANTEFSDEQSLTHFVALLAAALRGKRYFYWIDRIAMCRRESPETAMIAGAYHWAIGVADTAPVHLVESVYRRYLIDGDPEVRHLAAHTLIITYVRNGLAKNSRINDLRDFCAQDESPTVRSLADPSHPAYWLQDREK